MNKPIPHSFPHSRALVETPHGLMPANVWRRLCEMRDKREAQARDAWSRDHGRPFPKSPAQLLPGATEETWRGHFRELYSLWCEQKDAEWDAKHAPRPKPLSGKETIALATIARSGQRGASEREIAIALGQVEILEGIPGHPLPGELAYVRTIMKRLLRKRDGAAIRSADGRYRLATPPQTPP